MYSSSTVAGWLESAVELAAEQPAESLAVKVVAEPLAAALVLVEMAI